MQSRSAAFFLRTEFLTLGAYPLGGDLFKKPPLSLQKKCTVSYPRTVVWNNVSAPYASFPYYRALFETQMDEGKERAVGDRV